LETPWSAVPGSCLNWSSSDKEGGGMARAVWTGSLSFGLVNVPVALFSATEEKSIRFNQFQAGTSDRVRNKRVNERTGEEVPYQDIVKGYDLGGGEYVLLSPEEIASVAPGRSKTIDVSGFVDLADIDPVYFDRTYYLAPPAKGGGKGAERAYALLREAMLRSNKVALATFVLREKQYLVAIRPRADTLVVETLLYADEVRDPVAEIDTLPVEADWSPQELEMATMLIDSMTTAWDPEEHRDTYRERLEDLIEQKRSGAVVAVEPQAPEGAPVVDLLHALEASLRATRGGARDGTGRSGKARLLGPAAERAGTKKAAGAKSGAAKKAAGTKKTAAKKAAGTKKAAVSRRKAS